LVPARRRRRRHITQPIISIPILVCWRVHLGSSRLMLYVCTPSWPGRALQLTALIYEITPAAWLKQKIFDVQYTSSRNEERGAATPMQPNPILFLPSRSIQLSAHFRWSSMDIATICINARVNWQYRRERTQPLVGVPVSTSCAKFPTHSSFGYSNRRFRIQPQHELEIESSMLCISKSTIK
jgi:hypothetical protein